MGVVRVKDGVQFAVIAPGGFRILSAIDRTAQNLEYDLEITSGTDGEHSGPDDPHHRGEAFDLHTKALTYHDKQGLLRSLLAYLGLEHFYAFLEDPDTENEHIHIQVKKGTTYP